MSEILDSPVRRSLALWIGLGVFALSFLFLSWNTKVDRLGDRPVFFVDEAHKLAETYYYQLFFVERDAGASAWHEDFYARTNPPVAKYIFGAALAWQGTSIRDQQLQRDFEALWRKPAQLRSKVADEALRTIRLVSRVCGAFICLLLAGIAGRLGGPVAAVLAPVLALSHSEFLNASSRGTTDSILLLFLCLIVPVTWRASATVGRIAAAEGSGIGRVAIWSISACVLPGIVIALATGSKLNGALTGLVFVVSLLCSALMASPPERGRQLALAAGVSLGAAIIAVVLFVAINPYFYTEPIQRAFASPINFGDWMVKQKLSPGGALYSLNEKVVAAAWNAFLTSNIGWIEVGGGIARLLSAALLLFGIRCVFSAPSRREAITVACWAAMLLVGVTLWVPVAWARYFLPLTLVVSVLIALGCSACLRWISRVLADLRHDSPMAFWPRHRRSLAAASATLLGGAVISFASWPIDTTLLNPFINWPKNERNSLIERYRRAAEQHPDSFTRRRYLALLLSEAGDRRAAEETLAEAIGRLQPEGRDRETDVRRTVALFDASWMAAVNGNPARSNELLKEHVRGIEVLRDSMLGSDPDVRAAFDQLIGERRRKLRRLR